MSIHLRRMVKGSKFTPVELGLVGYGENFYIRLQTADGLDMQLGASAQDFISALEPMLIEMKARIGQSPGVLAGEMETRNEAFYRQFNLITINDLTDQMTPGEKWALLIERFKNSDQMNEEVELFKEMYKRATGQDYDNRSIYQSRNGGRGADPLAVLRRHAADLLDDDGAPKWGAQQRVAELLGFPNTGGAFRQKIVGLLSRLGEESTKVARAA